MQEENMDFAFAPIKMYPQKEAMTMQIEHAGRYKFLVKTRSPLSSLAQSSSNLLLNGQPVVTIQSNGTENEWVILKLNNIQLEAGTYQAELASVKPGLEIEWIEVTR